MYLISVYDGEGCFISDTEATGARPEIEEMAKELCRTQGGRFYRIQDLEKVKREPAE